MSETSRKYYIRIGKELVEVCKEVYICYYEMQSDEYYQKRRDWKQGLLYYDGFGKDPSAGSNLIRDYRGDTEEIALKNMDIEAVFRYAEQAGDELQILRLLVSGYNETEIGEIAGISQQAVNKRKEYLSGSGIHTITKELNRRKIPTKCGAKNWTYKPVSGILKNIVYTGTMLYQKYYTTETLPFREKRNYGERPMVMVENNHPPIISKEDFEKVQRLLAYRNATGEAEKSNRYDFTGKIVCGSCGTGFIRRTDRKKSGYKVCTWGCTEHTMSKDRCGQKAVKEEVIKEKFILLWNKLQSGKEEIFPPLLESLEKIRLSGGILEKIEEYDKRITEWIRQSQSLNQMVVQEYIDSAFYIEKNNELHRQIRETKEQRQKLLDQSETQKKTEETLALLRLLERESDFLEEYDSRLFLAIVEKIIIYPNNEMTFRLKNGMELTEKY